MKFWLIIIFTLIVTLLFALHHIFFINLMFIKNDYAFAFILLIPAILFSAYVFTTIALESKESQDKLLEHLIRESLHEINLPISTIEANIKMLKAKLEDEKSIKRAKRIEEALDRLKRLYNLLAYNLKREIYEIEKEEVELDKLVKNRVEFFKELNRNSFELSLKALKIKVDKIGLEQTVDNIIENAMKYSKKDTTIKITIDGTKLIIQDSGIGIEDSELSLIYQRYYQSDDNFTGEGIGLSIVKRYCDKESIGLKIESKKGVGTKVILDFKRVVTAT